MKGRVIITATPEAAAASAREGEVAVGANFDMCLTEVSGFDKLGLVIGLIDGLHYTQEDWLMLFAYHMGIGSFDEKNKRELRVSIPRKKEEIE